jgi:hypothetical protein
MKGGALSGLCRLLCLAFVGAVGLFSQQALAQDYAQDVSTAAKGPSRGIMLNSVRRTSAQVGRVDDNLGQIMVVPPLPGDQIGGDSADNPDQLGQEPGGGAGAGAGGGDQQFRALARIGANETKNQQLLMPPMTNFQQMGESKAFQDIYKKMITARNPVMAQTFYMVENGAASGFFNGLNMLSNTASNILEANEFQMKVLERTDPTGEMTDAWISSVFKAADEKKSWVAGMLAAAGDTMKDPTAVTATNEDPFDIQAQPFNFAGLNEGTNQQNNRESTVLLSTLLFESQDKTRENGTGEQYDRDQREGLKEEFIRMAGDLEIRIDGAGQTGPQGGQGGTLQSPARQILIRRIPPKSRERTSQNAEKRSGMALAQWEETGVAYEAFYKLLKSGCEWRKNNNNYRDGGESQIGKRKIMAFARDVLREVDLENASAPDLPMNQNVIDMALTMFIGQTPINKVRCEELEMTVRDMPKAQMDIDEENLAQCTKDGRTGCMRNRLFFHLAYVIGRSRALHRYMTLFLLSERFATTKAQRALLEQVINETVAGFDIQAELESNRERWARSVSFMGQRQDGKTGAGNSLPGGGENNVRRNAQGIS